MNEEGTTDFIVEGIVEGKEREPLYLNRMQDVFSESSESRLGMVSLCDDPYVARSLP